MATVTVSASTTLALLAYAADDDIVITGAATLTCSADPTALPKPRSISSASNRAKFKVRNSATAFSAGNLWKLQFNQTGAAIGTNASLNFTNLAELDIEGEMLECYTAAGTASETVLDASNVLGVDIDWPHAIEAETAPGSGVYERVPVFVVGGPGNGFLVTVTKANFGAGAGPGRVLFYDHTTRLLQTGDGTNGIIFAAGTKFRIPNILVWIDPFTITAAAGWTTATGSQPVVSSTNFPTVASAGVNVTAGGEVFNISAVAAGAVTVNGRGSEGTTATAHAAGTLLYAIPRSTNVTNYCGRLATNSNGTVRLKNCFFGRFWAIRPRSGAVLYCERAWLVAPTEEGLNVLDNTGGVTFKDSCVYTSIAKPAQVGIAVQINPCSVSVDNFLTVVQAAPAFATSYQNNAAALAISSTFNLSTLNKVRVWKGGIPTGVTHNNINLFTLASSVLPNGAFSGLEMVGGVASITGISGADISELRYSTTNGAANTTISETAFSFTDCANCIVRDYDVFTGGLAPYRAWFSMSGVSTGNIVHNQISGTPRSINCGSRTSELFSTFAGASNTHAASYFTSIRATSARAYSSNAGTNNTIRNVRWSELAGASFDNFTMEAQAPFVLDFPPVPISDTVTRAFVDGNTFYAAPNTFPSYLGGIYFGPTPAESSLDCYDLSGAAYTDRLGQFYYETSGDSIVFKSTQPIKGVGSIPGTAPQYSGNAPTTGATWEFKLCKWGDDISLVSWGSFTGGNVQTAFNALSGYSPGVGLNMQLRVTATTTSAGRYVRQLFVPAQMDTAYVPSVGLVAINVVGAAASALAALYNGGGFIIDTATTDGSGNALLDGPYDFDDVPVTGTLKVRELEHQSIDTPITWTGAATVPAAMAALTGYVAGPYAGASFNKGTKVVTVSSAMTTQDLWSAWREYIVQLVNFDTDDDWTYPELNAGAWEVAFSGAGSITGSYTDVNGTRAPITAPNLPVGARVQFYNFTDSVELTNEVLSGAGASTSLYFTTTKTIRLRASKLGSLPIEAFGVMTASGLTFIDEFVTDDVYVAKGIDGSTVTEFSADEPNVQIDSNDPDGTSSVWRCYAWFRYYETSSIGVAGVLFGAAQAIDTENLAIDSARADIQLDNVSAVPLKISDGYMYRTDGATIIAPTSGSIQMDPKKAYGVDGLLSGEIEPGFDLARTLRIIAAAVAGKTNGGPAGFTARNLADTTDQITGTATEDGNRTPTGYGA